MSEGKTAETNGSRNFEERVFARFDAIDGRMDRLEVRMDRLEVRLEQRFTAVDERFDRVGQRLDRVDGRLESLEARQFDTKPIWERVLGELETMKEQIINLDRKFDILTKDMIQVRADQKYVDKRLDRLESR
jgi:chromosome segregation ATPase